MSALHQRPVSANKAINPMQKQEAVQSKKPPKISSSLQHKPKSSGRIYLLLSVVALAGFLFLFSRTPSALSDSYALCSRDGAKIYTVDETNSQTQCIVVQNSYIIDTGALRESSYRSSRFDVQYNFGYRRRQATVEQCTPGAPGIRRATRSASPSVVHPFYRSWVYSCSRPEWLVAESRRRL
jgi:hypothetical protein